MAAGAGKLVAQFSGCTGLEPTGGRAASIERRRPPMPELGVGSAGGHFPYAWAVPGSHRAGPCDPGGAPYGRTEYGRPRCARGRIPGVGKGLNKGCGAAPRGGTGRTEILPPPTTFMQLRGRSPVPGL